METSNKIPTIFMFSSFIHEMRTIGAAVFLFLVYLYRFDVCVVNENCSVSSKGLVSRSMNLLSSVFLLLVAHATYSGLYG